MPINNRNRIGMFKVGQQFRVVDNTVYAHNIPLNGIGIVTIENHAGIYVGLQYNGQLYYVMPSQLENLSVEKKDILKEKEELEGKINIVVEKINFLEEIKATIFNETDFKCYMALKIAEDTNKPRIDRAKALRDLITN